MTTATCLQHEARDTPARYAAGRLEGPEAEDFELHLIGCASCQESVQLASAIRGELRDAPARSRRIRGWPVVLAGAVAATLVLAFSAGEWNRRRELGQLGAIGVMPSYHGIEVRAAGAPADSLFIAGMRAYVEGRTADALPLLVDARAGGADTATTSFFIGVLELRAGDARDALGSLMAAAARPSPYAAEARYYAAKAWLQLRRADSAMAQLEAAARHDTDIAAAARALADSVTEKAAR